jgi:hypothetical protein
VAIAAPAAFAAGAFLAPSTPATVLAADSKPAPAVGIARADGTGAVQRVAAASDLKVAAYDREAGKAKLTAAGSATAPAMKKGDVIASAGTPQLPSGALVKVTDATPDPNGAVAVQPATLPELLGDRSVNMASPVSAAGLTVKPLTAGVRSAVVDAAGSQPEPSTSSSPSSAPSKNSPWKLWPWK